MSRLASFAGPSTPSKTPVVSPGPKAGTTMTPKKSRKNSKAGGPGKRTGSDAPSPSLADQSGDASPIADDWKDRLNTPSSKIGGETIIEDTGFDFVETPIHRKLRQILLEIRSVARKWNELVQGDGFRAAKDLIDSRTTIKNSLALIPEGQVPRKPVVMPNMVIINEKILFLENMIDKLQSFIERLNTLCDGLETLQAAALSNCYTLTSPSSSTTTSSPYLDPSKPFYPTSTWPLSKFTSQIPLLLFPYYLIQLQTLKTMIAELKTPQIEWERARMVLAAWKDGRSLYSRQYQQQRRYHERENDTFLSSSLSPLEMVQIGGMLLEGGWSDELEEMCAVEIPNWR